MMFIKEYNDIDFDDFDWEEEDDIKDEIKQYFIDHPEEDNHDKVLSSFNLTYKEKQELESLFNKRNKYTELYDDIDYDRIKEGSIIMSNIINITSEIKEHIVIRVRDDGMWIIELNNFIVKPYNIKKVIKY